MRVLDRKPFKESMEKRLARIGDERVKELLGLARWKKAETSLSLSENTRPVVRVRAFGDRLHEGLLACPHAGVA